jgi:hypothetical protein
MESRLSFVAGGSCRLFDIGLPENDPYRYMSVKCIPGQMANAIVKLCEKNCLNCAEAQTIDVTAPCANGVRYSCITG